jgi:hypothetical protein
MQLNKFETARGIYSYFSISRRSYFSISRRYSFFAGFILGYLMLRTWFILEKSYFFIIREIVLGVATVGESGQLIFFLEGLAI